MRLHYLLLLLLLTGFVSNTSATDSQLYTQITEIEQDYTHFLASNDCNKFYTYNMSYCSIFGFVISYELYNTGTDIINVTTSDSELIRVVLHSSVSNSSIQDPFFVGMGGAYDAITTHHNKPGILNGTKTVIFIFPDYNSSAMPDGSYQLHIELLNDQVVTDNLNATIIVNDGFLSITYSIKLTSYQSATDSLNTQGPFFIVLLLSSAYRRSRHGFEIGIH